MSERKAINKYYPPDFDPSKVKKNRKQKKTGPASWPSVRLMIPFSMKCLHCNEYMAQSKKFNARKEVTDEHYLQHKIIRFHIRCTRCNSELIFKTDPKNGDFECVSGVKRNYERSTATAASNKAPENETFDEMLARLEEEDRLEQLNKEGKKPGDAETGIEQLEKRLKEQQREQELIDELDDLQQRSRKFEKLKDRAMKEDRSAKLKEQLDAEDSEEAVNAFKEFRQSKPLKSKVAMPDTEVEFESVGKPTVKVIDSKSEKVVGKPSMGGLVDGYSSKDDDSDSEIETTISLKRKPITTNLLGVSVKRAKA